MQRNLLIRLIFSLAVFSAIAAKAQLSGTVTVPGTYGSLSSAILDINTQGVNGPLTVLVQAAYVETVSVGGFSLTATGTAANPILFQRTGAGANPLLVSYTGGTGTSATAVQDGIWRFIGSDYVTIDGIDLQDQNTANPATMEYGFGFFKSNPGNGCQNNLITNCRITLNYVNNANSSGPSVEGSRGIHVTNAMPTAQTSNLTPFSSAGSNSYNHFYNNYISNCNVGISIIGYSAPSPYTLADWGNEVGGLSAVTGNTIINFGGAAGATNPAAGIRTLSQYDFIVAHNTINSNDGSGSNHANVLRGIYLNTAPTANSTVLSNTISLKSNASTQVLAAIENLAGAGSTTNTLIFQGNLFTGFTHTLNTTGSLFGIYNNGATAGTLIISDNSFSDFIATSTTGSDFLIYNNAAISSAVTFTNNIISNINYSASTSGSFFGIRNNGTVGTDLELSNNTFTNCAISHATGALNLIYNGSAVQFQSRMSANLISNFSGTCTSSGTIGLIYNNAASAQSLIISSNTISATALMNNSGACHVIYNRGALSNTFATLTLSDNLLTNITYGSNGAGPFYSIWNNGVNSSTCSVSSNTIINNNWLTNTNVRYGIANWGVSAVASVSSNLISNCTASLGTSGQMVFVYSSNPNAVSSGTLSIISNTISNNSFSSTTGDQISIYNAGVTTNTFDLITIANNRLSANNFSISGSGGHYGIYNNIASAFSLSIVSNSLQGNTYYGNNGALFHLYNRGQAGSYFGSTAIQANLMGSNSYVFSANGNLQLLLNAGVSTSTFSQVILSANIFTNSVFNCTSAAVSNIVNSAAISGSISIQDNLIAQFTHTNNLTGSIIGIQNSGIITGSLIVTTNTITQTSTNASSGSRYYFYNTGVFTGAASVINNLLVQNTHNVSGSGSYFHFYNNSGTGGALTISNNTITSGTSAVQNGGAYGIYNSSSNTNTLASITMESNAINNYTAISTTGSFYGVFNNLNSSPIVSLSSNTLSALTVSGTTGSKFLVVNSGIVTGSINITSNLLSNNDLTGNTSGSSFGIYNTGAVNLMSVFNNTLSNLQFATTTASVFGIYNLGNSTGSVILNSNLLDQLTYSASSSGYFAAVQNGSGSSSNIYLLNNRFQNSLLRTNTGGMNFICNRGAIASTLGKIKIQGNLINNIDHGSTTGTVSGVFSNGYIADTLSIVSNTIMNVAISGTANARVLLFNSTNTNSLTEIDSNLLTQMSFTTVSNVINAALMNSGASSGTIALKSNSVTGLNLTSLTTSISLIQNIGSAAESLSVETNVINQNTVNVSGTGLVYAINNITSSGNLIDIKRNRIQNLAITTSSSSIYLLNNSRTGTNTSSSLNIVDNSLLTNQVQTGLGASIFGISSASLGANLTAISNNTFNSNSFNFGSGSMTFLNNNSSCQNLDLTSNLFLTNTVAATGSGILYGVLNNGNAGNLNLSANIFSTTTISGAQINSRYVSNGAALSSVAIISNNFFSGNNQVSAGSGYHNFIHNSGNIIGALAISSNSFNANQNAVFSGSLALIHHNAATSGQLNVSSNVLKQTFSTSLNGFAGNCFGILLDASSQGGTLSVNQNTFSNFNFNSGGTGELNFISNKGNPNELNISQNVWSAMQLAHIGPEQLIYNEAAQNSLTVSNNSIVSGYQRTGAAGDLYIYLAGTSTVQNTSEFISDNDFSNISATTAGFGSFYGLYSKNAADSKTITGNKLENINYNASGFMYLISADGLGNSISTAPSVISNNTVNNVYWAGPFFGLEIGPAISSNVAAEVFGNAVESVSATAGITGVYGVNLNSFGAGVNLFRNKIGGLREMGGSGTLNGLYLNSASSSTIINNVIGDLAYLSTQSTEAINGMKLWGSGQAEVAYNTVLLSGSFSGTNAGSSALFAATTLSLDLQNNILINNLSANGTGKAVAYRRNGLSLSNFSSSSDRNILYAGIPSLNRGLFYDGAVLLGNIPAYQSLVTPREANCGSENTVFQSTLVASAVYLHVDPSVNTISESGALNITGISDDVDQQVRAGNPGYAGSGTNPDVGADEFEMNLQLCTSALPSTITAAGGSVICEGTNAYLYSSGYSSNGGITFQWKVSASAGGPYANVVSGSGSNQPILVTSTLSSGTYYFVFETRCNNGPLTVISNEYTLNVGALPGASVSINPSVICSGASVSLTGQSASGANYFWRGPSSYTSSSQNPVIQSANPLQTGNYTLVSNLAGCKDSAVVALIVNVTPPSFSISPISASICIGGSQILNASIPISTPTLNVGFQTSQNALAGYPAPYSAYYGGQKMQFLILANELSASGFTVGTPITSISFPVVSLGTGWGTAIQDCQNFQLSAKATALNTLTQFQTGMTVLVPTANYTPSPGYGNTHTFVSPFVWDGLSNLVIETVFSNNIIGGGATSVIQNNTNSGFLSTLVYRADNQNFSTLAAATTSNINIGLLRPDFRLTGLSVGSYSWSPSIFLNATNNTTAIATPTANTVFSVNLDNGFCVTSNTVNIVVFNSPTITVAAVSNTLCLGNTVTLSASGSNQFLWSTGATTSSITVAPFGSTNYYVQGINGICPNTLDSIFVTVLPPLSLSVSASPSVICVNQTSTLTANGAASFSWTSGATGTVAVVNPLVSTVYTLTGQTGLACKATKTVNVRVNPLPLIVVNLSSPTICAGEQVKLVGAGAVSYTWGPGGTTGSQLTTNPIQNTTFTLTGRDLNNCVSSETIALAVSNCDALNESETSFGLKIYPNPSRDFVFVQLLAEQALTLELYSSDGKQVYTYNGLVLKKEIPLSLLPRGLYLLKVTSPKISQNIKITVE